MPHGGAVKGAAAGKYVPRFRRAGAAATPPAEQGSQPGHDDHSPQSRQKERKLEEKERQRREALLSKNTDPLPKPTDSVTSSHLVEPVAAAAAASAPRKYVPRFLREGAAATPSAKQDRQCRHDDRPPQSRQIERELEEKERLRRETLLSKNTDPLPRPTDSIISSLLVEPVGSTTVALTPGKYASRRNCKGSADGKYVPRFLHEGAAATHPAEQDKQCGHVRPPQSRQKERKLEKERQRREALLSNNTEPFPRLTDSVTSSCLVEEPVAAASAPGKYAPRFRGKGAAAGKYVPWFLREGAAATPPAEQERQRGHDDRPPQAMQKERELEEKPTEASTVSLPLLSTRERGQEFKSRKKKIEEKKMQRREALLSKNTDLLPRPTDSVTSSPLVELVATAAASARHKYVPRFRRYGAAATPPAEQERHDDRPPQSGDMAVQ